MYKMSSDFTVEQDFQRREKIPREQSLLQKHFTNR